MQYNQQMAEWMVQLIEYQLKSTLMLEPLQLKEGLIKAITGIQASILCGRHLRPIDVINTSRTFFKHGQADSWLNVSKRQSC